MLAAAAVTFVGIVSLAFLIIAIQQQAEDRRVEQLTMAHMLKLAQRYRGQWRVPATVPAPRTAYDFEEQTVGAGLPEFSVEPRMCPREERKIGARETSNDARKRAA